jgi:hypothetical protein
MRRKIEKYLSKKQGVDQANIRYTEDGRFDFMGDLEGVLSAVRGKDGTGRGRGKDRNCSKKKKKKPEDMMQPMRPSMFHMPYAPYGMAPHGMPRGPPMNMALLGAKDKKALEIYGPGKPHPFGFSPWQHPGAPIPPPMPPADITTSMSPFDVDDDDDDDDDDDETDATPAGKTKSLQNIAFTAGCMSSTRKSVFDSPKSLGGNLGLNMMSPTDMNVQGMTPMSSLHDTFATPFQKGLIEGLSPEDDDNLNKMLFAEDGDYQNDFLKTPNFQSTCVERIHFRIGNDSAITNGSMADLRINRVAISPISQSAGNSSFFSDGDSELHRCFQSLAEVSLSVTKQRDPVSAKNGEKEASDKEMMPPPSCTKSSSKPKTPTAKEFSNTPAVPGMSCTMSKTRTPQNVTHDMGAPTPFGSTGRIMGSIMTPSTAASSEPSFWSQQLGFTPGEHSFTPFKSPAATKAKTEPKVSAMKAAKRQGKQRHIPRKEISQRS